MKKIISFDIQSDFGLLKKPDTNEPVYITYNMLHKPALLGILGAILGLSGFKIVLETGRKKKREYIPEYYDLLKELLVGIAPLRDERGSFSKTIIQYNNGVGYASKEVGGNLIIAEQTLIKPSYRCYLMLDLENEIHESLHNKLLNQEAEYLPYLGKNDFSLWWDNFQDYGTPQPFDFSGNYKVISILKKSKALSEGIAKAMGRAGRKEFAQRYTYFERLPISYHTDLKQYEMADFAYSNATLEKKYQLDNLYQISNNENIQLF